MEYAYLKEFYDQESDKHIYSQANTRKFMTPQLE